LLTLVVVGAVNGYPGNSSPESVQYGLQVEQFWLVML